MEAAGLLWEGLILGCWCKMSPFPNTWQEGIMDPSGGQLEVAGQEARGCPQLALTPEQSSYAPSSPEGPVLRPPQPATHPHHHPAPPISSFQVSAGVVCTPPHTGHIQGLAWASEDRHKQTGARA